MDSDLLGILLALLTFVVPAITAAFENKKKKKKTGIPHSVVEEEYPSEESVPEDYGQDSRVEEEFVVEKQVQNHIPHKSEELAELFNVLLGLEKKEEIEEVVESKHEVEEKEEPVQAPAPFEEGKRVTQSPVAIQQEPSVAEAASAADEGGAQMQGIKEKLRKNPKEAVIFAEILNPKYKEY